MRISLMSHTPLIFSDYNPCTNFDMHDSWHSPLFVNILKWRMKNDDTYFIFNERLFILKICTCRVTFLLYNLTLNLHTSVQITHFINLHQILSIIQQNNNMQISDPHAIFIWAYQYKPKRNDNMLYMKEEKKNEPFFALRIFIWEFVHALLLYCLREPF